MSGLPPGPVPTIDAHEAKALHDADKAVIVDVRETHEWQAGHVPGTLHIPLQTLPQHLDKIPKEATVIMLCHSGARSHHAANWLRANGYDDVLNLENGIVAWANAGLPIQ
ncbi:MAG: rhodanese-like domain-containing protein [Euryarchaeota archaeon]|nr:rhodanese-like domain-containing protein [Euryarchaeota archaeon]